MQALPYKTYFEEMPCYISVQDRDLKLLAANRRFRENFGSIEGRYCYQVYKHRPEKCEACPVERTFHDGQSHSSEEFVQCLDGRDVSVIVYTTPIRNEYGEIHAVMEMSTDITELKNLQKQLKESQRRYRMLFEEVPCFISIQDRDLNVIDANRLHRETFGERYGGKCYELYKHREEECMPCVVRQSFEDGQVHVHEEVVTSLSGEPINVLVHTAPLRDIDGNIDHVIEMSTDITQIRQLQDQLTNIGLLISTISHGIKGLLNGLDGGVYLVNSGMKTGKPERLEQGWEIVLRNISRIRSMVLDILYYARDREIHWEVFEICELLQTLKDVLKVKAEDLNIDFTIDCMDNIGTLEADRKAIRSCLVNILENSFDACRVDKKKDEHQVKLKLDGDKDRVRMVIQDNGIGMDRETREKAFSLFFSSKGNEGTGLGLFIADKIITSHGGSIQLDSRVDEGCTFHIQLPRHRDRVEPDARITTMQPDMHYETLGGQDGSQKDNTNH